MACCNHNSLHNRVPSSCIWGRRLGSPFCGIILGAKSILDNRVLSPFVTVTKGEPRGSRVSNKRGESNFSSL